MLPLSLELLLSLADPFASRWSSPLGPTPAPLLVRSCHHSSFTSGTESISWAHPRIPFSGLLSLPSSPSFLVKKYSPCKTAPPLVLFKKFKHLLCCRHRTKCFIFSSPTTTSVKVLLSLSLLTIKEINYKKRGCYLLEFTQL